MKMRSACHAVRTPIADCRFAADRLAYVSAHTSPTNDVRSVEQRATDYYRLTNMRSECPCHHTERCPSSADATPEARCPLRDTPPFTFTPADRRPPHTC
jgi:hypothetical protein